MFKDKMAEIKKKNTEHHNQTKHNHPVKEVVFEKTLKSPRQQLCIQEPVYICKKTHQSKRETNVKNKVKSVKSVEPFVPIQIPKSPPSGAIKSPRKYLEPAKQANREIEIHIEKDNKGDKECLKKLFKKIHKLTDDLKQSERMKNRLEVQLKNLSQIQGFNRNLEKDFLKMEAENYKLNSQIQLLKKQLKDKDNQITQLKNKTPQQVLKEIVVEKPIQVQVQVPKYVQGPETVIEVPKYVDNPTIIEEVERGRRKIEWLEMELNRERERARSIEEKNSIPAIIEKPVYLQKPVYVEKPVYIDRPIERQKTIEVPVEVPLQVPVYIEKPLFDEEVIQKITDLEKDVMGLMKENEHLRGENEHLKSIACQLSQNIGILKKHNEEKNYEIESLLHNIKDYEPMQKHINYDSTFNH